MDMSRFKEHAPLQIGIGLSAIALGIIWFVAIWRFGVSEDFVPLHYTIYFGLDRFGPKHDLFLFPVLGTVVLAMNMAVSRMVFWGNALWQGILMGLTFLMEMILLTSLVLAVLKGLS